MRIIITERQYKLLEEEQKTLKIPFEVFNNDWDKLQHFLNKKGNPPYEIIGDLKLDWKRIESLGNLTSVEGDLFLANASIESLGNLTSVGGDLFLGNTSIKSLGNLQSVGGYLYLGNTPISKKYSKKQIKRMVNVGREIYK